MPFTRAPLTRQGIGGLFNFGTDYPASNRNLRRTRAAKNRVRAASGSAYIACIGDSNTRGTGSDNGALNGTAGYNGWPNKLAALLTASGLKAQCENFFCTGGYQGLYSTYDNRIVLSSGVAAPSPGSGVSSIAGALFQFTANSQTLTFTTKTACTQADFFYVPLYGTGSITYAIDGGAATTASVLSTGGTFALQKVTFPLGALAVHTIVITLAAGNALYFLGLDCYDATTPLLHILNWGWHGSTTASWTPTTGTGIWTPTAAIPSFFKPDLIIGPCLGTNDFVTTSSNIPVNTTSANKQALLSSWSSVSDTILLTVGPTAASGFAALSGQKPYVDADYALAVANGLPLLDEWAAMGDEPFMQAAGLYNTDFLHKTAAGHFSTAELMARAILAA